MVGMYAMEHCILVHLVMEGFGRVILPRHCWGGLVVDYLPAVDYWIGFRVGYFGPSLVDY